MVPPRLPALLAAARASKLEPLPEANTARRADLAESTTQSSRWDARGQTCNGGAKRAVQIRQ